MIPSICEKFCILFENERRCGEFFVKNWFLGFYK